MSNIISIDDAREAAQKTSEDIAQQNKKQKNIIESVMEEVVNINPALGGFEELSGLLALPDEHFMIIAPVFLDELEKSFNNTNDKMVMVQAMNAAGLKAEDLQKEYLEIITQIDKDMTFLSRQKRDFLKRMLAITYNMVAEAEGVAKRVIQIPIELCHPDAVMPSYANLGDAGLDIYALEDITIHPGETKLIPTGLKVAIPYGYELQVRPKSGRALKTKFRIANSPGTIDSGYRDEIGVIIDNIEPFIADMQYEPVWKDGSVDYLKIMSIEHGRDFTIGKGEKFAQLVLNEIAKASFYAVESVATIENDGRQGGFGSTGV